MVGFWFSSVAQSRLTLCDPMDCHMPGFPVHHQLPELAQTHVYWVGDAIQPSHSLLSPSPPAFSLSQHQTLHTVMSDSLRPCGLYSPWNYPGQNTGVGSCSLLQGMVRALGFFSNRSVLRIRWPKYQNFSISPSNEYSGLKSFRINWFDLFAVQGTLKSLLQHHSSKASILQGLTFSYGPTLTYIHDYWKNCSFECTDPCWVMSL